ncbi:exported hypothetical protein [[Clostridium] ultunense Esp]|uniref:hypothetical protein n=1 Tax=Thermicanus aegyptius TaxID=94009 RepID=UPI0002B70B82|nr:hypothetical protein [Thermicanus aegyptius]CCQ97141.1 exported hypothetical protein [[Clostridium] ultunense Esp]
MKKAAKWIVGITSVATLSGTLGLIQMGANTAPTDEKATTPTTGTEPNAVKTDETANSSALPFDYAVGVRKDFPTIPYYISDETMIQGMTEEEVKDFFQSREAFLASLDWEESTTSLPPENQNPTVTNPSPDLQSGPTYQAPSIQAPSIKSDRRTRSSRR